MNNCVQKKITWGSCPVCGDCGEPIVTIEHVIDGWTDIPKHIYTCPVCGKHSATVLDCEHCYSEEE